MLRITTIEKHDELTLKLEGKLTGPWVDEFEHCWSLAWGRCKNATVDLTGVTFFDSSGKKLLALMHNQGVKFVGSGLMARSLIDEITGKAIQDSHPEWAEKAKHQIIKAVILLILPMVSWSRSLNGQDRPPLRLGLREAIRLALKQNPEVQIANLNLAQSEQDHALARSALLPQVGLEGFDRAERFNIQALIGGPFPGTPQHAGPFQEFQVGPNFSMPVFDLTLWRRWQAAHYGVRANAAQETTVREQIVLLVVSQYLGGLRAGASVKAGRSRVELAQALYDQALDLQKQGVGTGIDTLRANVQLQNEKQRLFEAETQQRVALYGLVRLLNLDPHQTVELGDEPSFYETPEFEASQSLERALETRPEMRALASREQIARLQKQGASESRLPTINLGGGWAYQGLSAPSSIPSYQYQVTVDVPLFTSGRIRAQMTRAELELKKTAREREDLGEQIALEVKTAIAQLESARHEVEVATLGVNLAQEEVTQARDRFQAGVVNNIEVITAQDELARANDNQIVALYRYNQSRADLARAIGQIEGLYTK
jgi:outer membrane protein